MKKNKFIVLVMALAMTSSILAGCTDSKEELVKVEGVTVKEKEAVEEKDTEKEEATNVDETLGVEQEDVDYNELVMQALLAETPNYYMGECPTEGHIILGEETKGENTFLYTLTMVGNYGFENGSFNKVSGSGVIPAVFTIVEGEVMGIEYPLDGSGYVESIEDMFPKEYLDTVWDSVDSGSDNYKIIKDQEMAIAQAYLDSIGRDAPIEVEVERKLITDMGVSAEVSNGLENFFKEHNAYPYYVGSAEVIEDGVRMVYEMRYETGATEIEFIKYIYDNEEVVEEFKFDAKTGRKVSEHK